ncbi:MAG: glycosyltransferase family 2 protein [Flavobacteriaceae bacterium]|nr:glycosyltransferase family 2 protein [Flavobacteriaceae bacterium]
MQMIFYHNSKSITSLESGVNDYNGMHLMDGFLKLAQDFPDHTLVWCHESVKEELNQTELNAVFYHDKLLVSYSPNFEYHIKKSIGYVELTPFVKINKEVTFPTWFMSSLVGGVHATVIQYLKKDITKTLGFDYFINSLAYFGMLDGLLCYSNPTLLKNKNITGLFSGSNKATYQFTKEHLGQKKVFLLFWNRIIHDKSIDILSLLSSFSIKRKPWLDGQLEGIEVSSKKKVVEKRELDVIIPTIGRREYLYDVLVDFKNQPCLPKRVNIVEQNPDPKGTSDLDYIENEAWPFEIEHIFIHKTGVCNARNLALSKTNSEWVFLSDDDGRFEPNLIADVFDKLNEYGAQAATTSYLQSGEIPFFKRIVQWPTFGAGNSFVRRDKLENLAFSNVLEFGYGEDKDFGMQLRNEGVDIIYLPQPEILHLKAPIGGFRFNHVKPWDKEEIEPKPTPTMLLYYKLHYTEEQIRGNKTLYLSKRIAKSPASLLKIIKQWKLSDYWATKLLEENEV